MARSIIEMDSADILIRDLCRFPIPAETHIFKLFEGRSTGTPSKQIFQDPIFSNFSRKYIEANCNHPDQVVWLGNQRLVVRNASRYRASGKPLEDLIQFGQFGLCRAIQKFDHHRGLKFSTYATPWIRSVVARSIAETSGLISTPMNSDREFRRINRARESLSSAFGGDQPEMDEVLALVYGADIPKAALHAVSVMDCRTLKPTLSLDLPFNNDHDSDFGEANDMEDVLTTEDDTENLALTNVEKAGVRHLLGQLSDTEIIKAICLTFGIGDEISRSAKEVAEIMKCPPSKVRRLLNKGLVLLKERVNPQESYDL